MLVPGLQYPVHPSGILGVPGHGGPVDVPDHHATAGAKGALNLGQRRGDVRDVLEHLDAERSVEAVARDRQRGGIALLEARVAEPLGAAPRHSEHLRALVNARDRALRTDLIEELARIEAGAAADVEDAVTGLSAKRLVDELPAPQNVARPVEDLELLDDLLVEDELAHGGRPPSGRA